MFDTLGKSFGGVFKQLSGKGSISESNVRESMAEVENALLEADVHYDVAKDFCKTVLDDAIGQKVTQSLKPGEQMVGIVHHRLVELLGGQPKEMGEEGLPGVPNMDVHAAHPGIMEISPGPTVVMMCGLQGSGKTTTCGKLAAYLRKQGRSVMLAAADLQRPAAVEQLETVARQVREQVEGDSPVEFYGELDKVAEYGKAVGVAVDVCRRAHKAAKEQNIDVLILDTAGRLHVNDDLMDELRRVDRTLEPHQIFLVVDSMTGQDAVNSAKSFNEQLRVDGVILTKFDSDTRGGAALSIRTVTGAPIRFIGTGEKHDAMEEFHAERVAGRILGMGDVVSLVEKAQEQISEEEAMAIQEKMMKGELTMEDFVKQLRTLRKMGPMKQILGMLPGVGQMLQNADVDEKQLDRTEAIIGSMTKDEKQNPDLINNSRRKRVAGGSGTEQPQVSQLVKQFGQVSKLTKQMASMSAGGKVAAMRSMGAGMAGGGGMPGMGKGSTKAGGKKRFKQKKRKR